MARKRKNNLWRNVIIFGVIVIILLFSFNFYLASQIKTMQPAQNMSMMGTSMSRMSFTEFDKQRARELMDKNNDGKCDTCGMPIDECIASGMMQCSMDPDAKIGVLGTQHIHADWNIYIDGKPIDWTPYSDRHERQMQGDATVKDTSAFIHIHPSEGQEKGGDVLHMHATGVPLRMFFESLDMSVEGNCITIAGKKTCDMKMYVNGKENTDYGAYVFTDLDKILITDGKGNVEEQLKSITNFAEAH